MKLWTLQPRDVLDQLEETGSASGRPDFARDYDDHPAAPWGFRRAYGWMMGQMRARVGPPPAGVDFPMWAWARPPSPTTQGSPDLRSMRCDSPGVMLELEVDPSLVLLSDHGSWHHVLNAWPLAVSEAISERQEDELRALCSSLGAPLGKHGLLGAPQLALPAVLDYLDATWVDIFKVAPLIDGQTARMDLGPLADPQWTVVDDPCVQACLWRIEKSQVVKTTLYSGWARRARSPS